MENYTTAENYSETGLSLEEVRRFQEQGYQNRTTRSITKTKSQIIRENVFTLFNLLNLMIAFALMMVQAWSNLVFILIIAANVLIGILQELHAKKLVDELSLLMSPMADVVREGNLCHIPVEEVVLNDLMMVDSGQQICCDAVVIRGEVENNESLLSGESDPIHKKPGSLMLSGSSVISGKCYARVTAVGEDNYAQKIAAEAKKLRKVQSELMRSMEKVTRVTSYMIIPLGILLFIEAFVLRGSAIDEAVITSAAGLLGMLPKGLVLLISVSLAAGVGKLAKQKILIQDLYSLETLAHVDTLCLDKTGTITSGRMSVDEVMVHHTRDDLQIKDYIQSFLYHSDDNNATNEALCEYFGKQRHHQPSDKIAFSSQRKWSAVSFAGFGTLVMGAPERLLKEIPVEMMKYIKEGKRLIVMGVTQQKLTATSILRDVEPLYTIVLSDQIRTQVQETLAYFKKEGVDIKIISGDHVDAVAAIARKAGLDRWDACVDMSQVEDSEASFDLLVKTYSVFGRVTPNQKKQLVQALQRQGHKVAMTGDGVNDMLALKEADCSIAIAEGSDAVRQIAQVVLLNSEFSALPDVVLEGRRVVNNVTRVAGVFFIKTIYSIALSMVCAVLNMPFPFLPIQITLIDAAVEAMPAFLTMLEPDHHKISTKFLPSVFRKALPNAAAILFVILMIMGMTDAFAIPQAEAMTMMYAGVAVISMMAVIRSCLPMSRLRFLVCTCMTVGFIMAVILFHDLFELVLPSYRLLVLSAIIILAGLLLERVLRLLIMYVFPQKSMKTVKESM